MFGACIEIASLSDYLNYYLWENNFNKADDQHIKYKCHHTTTRVFTHHGYQDFLKCRYKNPCN